jgi:spore maturation protein CgeB
VNDIIFIGSLLYRSEFHHDRIAYVEEILRKGLPLTMYGMIEEDSWHLMKVKQVAYLGIKAAEKMGIRGHLKNRQLRKIAQLNEMPVRARYSSEIRQGFIKDQLYGKNMLKEISNHAVSFNMHARVAGEYAANVRMFEVTGAGSLLMSDHKRNIHELFEPGEEILTYGNMEECVEKLRWALDNPVKAAEIAARGQKRTLKDHSVEKRVELLMEILEKELKLST